jgi:hypothetical protein
MIMDFIDFKNPLQIRRSVRVDDALRLILLRKKAELFPDGNDSNLYVSTNS